MAENKGGSLRWNFTPISGLERAPTYNWYPWPGTVFRKKSINKFLLGPWKTQRKFRRKTETTATSYLVSFNFSPTENFFLSSTIWFLEPMVFITLSYGIGPNQEKSHASTSRWKVLVYSPPPPLPGAAFRWPAGASEIVFGAGKREGHDESRKSLKSFRLYRDFLFRSTIFWCQESLKRSFTMMGGTLFSTKNCFPKKCSVILSLRFA